MSVNMKRYIIFAVSIMIAILMMALMFWPEVSGQNKNAGNDAGQKVCVRSKCYNVEVARTIAEWEKGLMFRQSLDKDAGMFFVYPADGFYPFWMKNTLIPLDMIWLDSNYKIVFVASDAQPCEKDPCPLVYPNQRARYVLEVNAGEMKNLGVRTGDTVTIK